MQDFKVAHWAQNAELHCDNGKTTIKHLRQDPQHLSQ